MELYIAGGCSEHGRNSFLVTGKRCCFLVDAGLMKEKPDKPYPELGADQIRKIDYLFLTHCHADHAGGIPWLLQNGFRGTVVASRTTQEFLPFKIRQFRALEDFAGPMKEFRLENDLYVTWGRSGHCIGSVWFLFRMKDKSILFSGDYEERSYAYKCDKIRDVRADIAVVDCAYGPEKEGADAHRKNLEERISKAAGMKAPVLFPVPSHGRGFDVLRLLADNGMTAVLSESLVEEYRSPDDRRLWLKRGFLDSMKDLRLAEIREFETGVSDPDHKGILPKEYMKAGILVRDSQLTKEINRKSAEKVLEAGGQIILTGKQDPSSYARKLFDEGKADFCRISVHQNTDEMLRLLKRNSFRVVIPYHCREKLKIKKKKILVLNPGDRVKF